MINVIKLILHAVPLDRCSIFLQDNISMLYGSMLLIKISFLWMSRSQNQAVSIAHTTLIMLNSVPLWGKIRDNRLILIQHSCLTLAMILWKKCLFLIRTGLWRLMFMVHRLDQLLMAILFLGMTTAKKVIHI